MSVFQTFSLRKFVFTQSQIRSNKIGLIDLAVSGDGSGNVVGGGRYILRLVNVRRIDHGRRFYEQFPSNCAARGRRNVAGGRSDCKTSTAAAAASLSGYCST